MRTGRKEIDHAIGTAAMSEQDLAVLTGIAAKSVTNPHLATLGHTFGGRPRITLHVAADLGSRRDRAALADEMRASGLGKAVRVRSHSGRRMASAGSLEAFAASYGHEPIVYDPTGVIGRARLLGAFARRLRKERGAEVAGIYWHSQWRTVYVVLDHRHFFKDGMTHAGTLAHAEATARNLLAECCGEDGLKFIQAVRLSFELPDVALTPIDTASLHRSRHLLSGLGGKVKGPVLATMVGLAGSLGAGSAGAADLVGEAPLGTVPPAVSAPNAKIGISGGKRDFEEINDVDALGLVEGSVTVPLSERFGLQIDGAGGSIEDGHIWGVGGHLFWRDPTVGLFGVVGAYGEVDREQSRFLDQQATTLGAEMELYADQFTFYAMAGAVFGDNIDDGFYGSVDLGWYATDNLQFKIGAASSGDTPAVGTASVEWQPALEGISGLTFFAEGAIGSDDFASVRAGLRLYFGQGPTLKHRHRYDDPEDNAVTEQLENGVYRPKLSYGG